MIETPETVAVNLTKVRETEDKVIELLQASKLTRTELLTLIGLVLVDAGASVEECPEVEMDSIYRLFAEKPTCGRALMCMGADILKDWVGFKTLPGDENE